MITLPPVELSSQVKLAVDLEVPLGLLITSIGAPGAIGVNTVAPVPGNESSDGPITLIATIFA